jgi:hypothetical protein
VGTLSQFDACYSANGNAPIASELSYAGIGASGWTGVCDFHDGDKAVKPQGHQGSKQQNFEPKAPEPKEEPKKDTKGKKK